RVLWFVLSMVAYAFGLLAWEKSLLILPALFAFQVLVLEPRASWGQRVAAVTQRWWAWLAHAVMAGAYLALYLTVTDGSERAGAAAQTDFGRAVLDVIGRVFVPGLFGGP